MAKKTRIAASYQIVFENGISKVARNFSHIDEDFSKGEQVPDFLSKVDHSFCIKSKNEYKKALKVEQKEFNRLVRQLNYHRKSLIVVLQGRDGAGKTGALSRIEEALGFDHKIFDGVAIGPPTPTELKHAYFWRFMRHDRMPAFGQVRVFDRSWAERVLIEKVMKLTDSSVIDASYAELRCFEWLLQRQGCILVKLWLDISKDEQKRRFDKRKKDKPWKVSDSDDVARQHWDQYTDAANELFFRTATEQAPWFIVSSEDKHYSRVNALWILNQQLRVILGE